ncbi:hypothetical protein LMH73_009795 [Vibrio splendidus]|nr:hypothetical protein [Vibrio splendidus]MCC4883030.1 hypothetical protein [Vibrio splendidus]
MAANNCRKCGITFDGNDIYEHFLEVNGGDKVAALKSAKCYGWTKDNPKKFIINKVLVKSLNVTPDYYSCQACGDKVIAHYNSGRH